MQTGFFGWGTGWKVATWKMSNVLCRLADFMYDDPFFMQINVNFVWSKGCFGTGYNQFA
jgi:hypothetical protein